MDKYVKIKIVGYFVTLIDFIVTYMCCESVEALYSSESVTTAQPGASYNVLNKLLRQMNKSIKTIYMIHCISRM